MCRFYHWTVDYVLNMPAVSFYAFLKRAQIAFAKEAVRQVDMCAIPSMTFDYYKELRKNYTDVIHRMEPQPIPPTWLERHQNGPGEALSWDDPRAQAAIARIFRDVKRTRYGH